MTTQAPTEDDVIAVSAAMKRLRDDGMTAATMAQVWPSLSPATITNLLDRRNPWRPFTAPMRAAYSRMLRDAQAYENQRLLRVAEVAANVVSMADYRARKTA